MQFSKILTIIISLMLIFIIVKFTGTQRYDLLYTDSNSIAKYNNILSGYNNFNPQQFSESQIQILQDQITNLSNNTYSKTIKEKLLGLMDQSDSLKKLHQVSNCIDMINKLDKLTSDNISTTGLDSNQNPNCKTQIQIMKNKVKSINRQYQQYEIYKNIYMSGFDNCDNIQNIYDSIVVFNKQMQDFGPNDCNISIPKINLQNIGTNLKNIYSGDTVDSLVEKINIIKQSNATGTIYDTANTVANTFKNRRGKTK